MARQTVQVGFTIDLDLDELAPQTANVWLYRLLNDLANEHDVLSVTMNGVTVDTPTREDVYELPLGEDKPLE